MNSSELPTADAADRLAEFLLCWEEAWEHGDDIPPEQLCAEQPDLVESLRRQIDVLKKMDWMKKGADPDANLGDQIAIHDPLLSKILGGRYRIDVFLAEGGFGRVYRGYDPELDRPVAVKVSKATRAASPERNDTLLQEARRVAKLRYPGIVPIHDVGQDESLWFFVSDLIEGQNLAELIAKQKPNPADAAKLVAEIADSLHFAHQQGFVHRDIKPSNILIDLHGRSQITDFGIAATSEELTTLSFPTSGTLPYMAPEQVAGEVQLIGPGTDIYALGVVLYKLLTGQLPYQARTPTAMREQIVFRPPVVLRSLDANIPPALEAVCLRCLAKHPADRFSSAAELASALRSWKVEERKQSRRLLAFGLVLAVVVLFGISWAVRARFSFIDGPGDVAEMSGTQAELNRKAAEKIVRMGGEVEILHSGGRMRLMSAEGIPAYPFFVTEVKMVGKHPFHDEDVESLLGLIRLEAVYLSYTDITDRALATLAEIPTIQGLGIGENTISDEGLVPLTTLKRLVLLDLNTTPRLTDQAFQHLVRIENLRQLNVAWTSMTAEGVEEFKRQKPECHVYFDRAFPR